ncbi:acyl-CoA thioesterase II [Williamsia sp. 1138]|uniref:acyl-CoA thioesterase n=1 Tax=Williamsia sp. 1138 TaxID=1903117 RepID=UPI000A0F7F78|nr:acyl-CoA thioesterase domain-containing protein [Williamsia sp. 1138]OZG28867.1 acyl-CoA thioesterase II [Williamsia sp. 1138]
MIVDDLAEILDPESLGKNVFRARSRPSLPGRVFGGQMLGQAVISAGRTVPAQQLPHSLHAYFERAGDWALPIDYSVQCERDGRSSSRRRVVATQGEHRLLTAELSFHTSTNDAPEPVRQPIDVEQASWATTESDTDMVETINTWLGKLGQMLRLEVRFFEEPMRARTLRTGSAPAEQRFLVRPLDRLPDDPLVNAAALAYLSDMFLLATSLGPRGMIMGDPRVRAASLDHALWFQGGPLTGGWLLHETASVWSSSNRALCQGHILDVTGRHVARTTQEGLVRITHDRPS